MFATKQLEGAAHIQVGRVAARVAHVALGVDRGGAVFIRVVTLDRAHLRIVAIELVVQLQLGHPAFAQVMLKRSEHGAGVLLPVAPVGAVVE